MNLESGLGVEILESETLARFLLQSDDFSKAHMRVKPRAFMPMFNDKRNQWETSVTRTMSLSHLEIHVIGGEVAIERQKSYYGFASTQNSAVNQADLHSAPDEPPPRHALILGWSTDIDKYMRKAANQSKALALASDSNLILQQSPT